MSAAVTDAVRLLHSAIGPTTAQPACRTCAFVCDPGIAERRVIYREIWDCEDAFRRHLHSSEFRRVLLVMDLSCRQPRIVIENPARHTGFEYLRELWDKQECRA